jgi:hypothetical protein
LTLGDCLCDPSRMLIRRRELWLGSAHRGAFRESSNGSRDWRRSLIKNRRNPHRNPHATFGSVMLRTGSRRKQSRTISWNGAPRPMKMGTTVSLRCYDAAACYAPQPAKSAKACELALRLMGGCLPDFARWSGYPSIAPARSIPGSTWCANSLPSSTLDKRHKVRSNTSLGWRCIVAPYAGMRVSSVGGFSRSIFRSAPDAASFSLKE